MNPKVVEALEFIHAYAGHVDDWLIIKKELMKTLHPNERQLFSKRHPITKKQQTNDFERQVAESWSKMTGRPVVFSPA